MDKINVPVFMACQLTDEQTGGHCPTLAEHMTGTDKKWFTYTNGTHVDSLDPETYNQLYDFFNHLRRASRRRRPPRRPSSTPPRPSPSRRSSGSTAHARAMRTAGDDAAAVTRSRRCRPRSLAKAAFEAQQSIRVLFDNGAGNSGNPGWPYPGFEQSFSSFPVPGTTARSWYLAPDGALADAPATGTRADGFTWDAHARPLNDFTGDTGAGPTGSGPRRRPTSGRRTRPARRRLRDRSAEPGHDRGRRRPGGPLGAVLHAQRRPAGDDQRGPAGRQGDLRAERLGTSQRRALDQAKSTELEPVLSLRAGGLRADALRPLRAGHGPALLRGARLSRGSRIRVRISAPNGDQPIWSFGETEPAGTAEVEIGYGNGMPSASCSRRCRRHRTISFRLARGLRGEPCRDYAPFENASYSLDSYPRPGGATPLRSRSCPSSSQHEPGRDPRRAPRGKLLQEPGSRVAAADDLDDREGKRLRTAGCTPRKPGHPRR